MSKVLENSGNSVTLTVTIESQPEEEVSVSEPLKFPSPYTVPLNSNESPLHIKLSIEELKKGSSVTFMATTESHPFTVCIVSIPVKLFAS